MPKRFSSKEIVSALDKKGFVFVSQRGSHAKYRRRDRTVVVPVGKKQIPAGTFGSIVRQAGLVAADFE